MSVQNISTHRSNIASATPIEQSSHWNGRDVVVNEQARLVGGGGATAELIRTITNAIDRNAPQVRELFVKLAKVVRVILIALPILAVGIGVAIGASIGSGSILPIAITFGILGLVALVCFIAGKMLLARLTQANQNPPPVVQNPPPVVQNPPPVVQNPPPVVQNPPPVVAN